jgi:hypothetical protein
MKFYQVRHYDKNYPGRTIILGYSGLVLFRYKGKILVKVKPNKKLTKNYLESEEEYLKGYVVINNDHLLFNPYIANGFIDGFKKLFNIKFKQKPINPFI